MNPVIVWFRRDLRLHDNLAMHAALEGEHSVLPLFILDPILLNSSRVGAPRIKFMLAALEALDGALKQYDRRLLVRRGNPVDVLRDEVGETDAEALYFNIDYTPFARRRDEAVREALDIPVHTFHDRLLVPPHAIEKNSGGPYTVYTPFKNKWRETPKPHGEPLRYHLRPDRLYDVSALENHGIPSLADLGMRTEIEIPSATPEAASDRLRRFLDYKIYDYADNRNQLANPFNDSRNGTSALSPYIRFGLISLREIRAKAADAYAQTQNSDRKKSVNTWMNEIIWHEFYTHVLWHFPHVMTENFNDRYNAVSWRTASDDFDAWKDGLTGYPVVDAAMRQLNGTGWMHNRARMIVASFLTKDLLIDWREGERYFMQMLLDGDSAANNGGWQWAAGTGTDAQPYFRIFNPVSQSQKFDPDGVFIKQWVPELADVPPKHIHEPWTMDNPPENYPAPIVDHSMARQRALDAFEVSKNT